MNEHLDDLEIQEVLEGGSPPPGAREHLERCVSCRKRLKELEALVRLFDEMKPWEAPRSIEERVWAALFPGRAAVPVRRRPLPVWARAAAAVSLFGGSAALYGFLQVFRVFGGDIARWVLQTKPQLLGFAAHKLTGLIHVLGRLVDHLADLAGAASVAGRAALLAGQTPEVRVALFASAGILVLIFLGWGGKLLYSQSKGGHHDFLLA